MTGVNSGSQQRWRMTPGGGRRPGRTVAGKLAVAAVAGFVVFLLRVPFSGDDSDPPICYSAFNYVVPCGSAHAAFAGVVAGVVVGFLLLLPWRRR